MCEICNNRDMFRDPVSLFTEKWQQQPTDMYSGLGTLGTLHSTVSLLFSPVHTPGSGARAALDGGELATAFGSRFNGFWSGQLNKCQRLYENFLELNDFVNAAHLRKRRQAIIMVGSIYSFFSPILLQKLTTICSARFTHKSAYLSRLDFSSSR